MVSPPPPVPKQYRLVKAYDYRVCQHYASIYSYTEVEDSRRHIQQQPHERAGIEQATVISTTAQPERDKDKCITPQERVHIPANISGRLSNPDSTD
ncbi:hypothetical protein TI39_contig1347g00001, partial [Zymoseptoria brevis]